RYAKTRAARLRPGRHPARHRGGQSVRLRHHGRDRPDLRHRVSDARPLRVARLCDLALGGRAHGAPRQAAAPPLLRSHRRRRHGARRRAAALQEPQTRVSRGLADRMKQRSLLLRALLAVIKAASWLAPPSRRREWQRQWRADIWHEWNWLERHPRGVAGPASLAGRTAGALQHAFWLRRIERITQDLRYGWRQMLRRPGVTIVAILTLGLGIGANVTMY